MERIECICNTEYIKKNLFAIKLGYSVCLIMFLLLLFCMRDVLGLQGLLVLGGIHLMFLLSCIIMHIYYGKGFVPVLLILTDDSLSYSNARGQSKEYRLEELEYGT